MAIRARHLLVAATLLLLLSEGAASGSQLPRLGQNVQATKEDLNPTRMYSGPYLAVDPADDMHVVASYIDFRTSRCGLLRSLDGGQTWKQLAALPAPASFPYCLATQSGNGAFHSPVAFGRGHTLYYALLGYDDPDGGGGRLNTSVLLRRSTDMGDSWHTTFVRNNRGKGDQAVENDRPITGIAVDTKTGPSDVVYVSWARRLPNVPPPNAEPLLAMGAVSIDGGRSFGDPFSLVADTFASPALRAQAIATATTTTVPGPTPTTTAPPAGSRASQPDQQANFGAFKSAIVVDAKGTLYAVWPPAVANMVAPPLPGYFLTKSTDKAKTWTVTQITPFSVNNRAGAPGPASALRLAWSPTGGPDDTLHLVGEGTDQPTVANLSHVFYYRSTDGGKTWSEPRIIDDDNKAAVASQYLPNVSVDELAARHRLDERLCHSRLGRYPADRPELRRQPSPGRGVQDVFTATVQYKTLGTGTSNALRAVLAGVIGLVVVGTVLREWRWPSDAAPCSIDAAYRSCRCPGVGGVGPIDAGLQGSGPTTPGAVASPAAPSPPRRRAGRGPLDLEVLRKGCGPL